MAAADSLARMHRSTLRVAVICALITLVPVRSPAPLVYVPGEGWRYEAVGESKWRRDRAKEQLELAQAAFNLKDYGLALKSARRTVTVWPYSDFAPEAQYLVARCYEAKGQEEKAFKAYQRLIERYPKLDKFEEITQRQFGIANRFLAGQRFKLFGVVPTFPSMAKTIAMYERIVKNGRYSDVAPQSQMHIGEANERKKALWIKAPDYAEAARAYEVAADRYSEKPVGIDALYKAGLAYTKQAKKAEYDQSVAGQAIATFNDFMLLHPQDSRVSESQKIIATLKTEQARGSYEIARFYEKRHRWQGALIYYNEVLLKDPTSKYAEQARQRIDEIKKRAST